MSNRITRLDDELLVLVEGEQVGLELAAFLVELDLGAFASSALTCRVLSPLGLTRKANP